MVKIVVVPSGTSLTRNSMTVISDLVVAIHTAHWNAMELLLDVQDTKCSRINAILRINEAMDKAIADVQALETKFVDHYTDGMYND